MGTRPPGEWPLVGRDVELAFCLEVLGAGRGLVLSGRPGVGKSRLGREILDQWPGRLVRSAIATVSAREIPFGALAHLAVGIFDPHQFANELRTSASEGERALLFVDDAHLLDDRSATLLVTLQQLGVSLVLTVRTGGPAPDAVQVLWKDEYLQRVEIQPLSRDEIDHLLTDVLAGPVAPSTSERLFAATEGNPLYLRHLVTAALSSADLFQRESTWLFSGKATASSSLIELVNREIGELSDSVRQLLSVLAFAEPLECDLLEALVGADSVRIARTRGLILIEAKGARLQVRFAHPLYGECIREAMTPAEHRVQLGVLAAKAASYPQRRATDDIRRAIWLLDAGACDDLDLLFRAGLGARLFSDAHLVERFAEAGLARGGGFNFLLGRALTYRWRGQYTRAAEVYDQLWDMAANDDERTLVLNSQPLMTFFEMRDEPRALTTLGRQAHAVTDPACRLLIRAIESILQASANNIEFAHTLAQEVLADWQPLADPADLQLTHPRPLTDRPVLRFVPDARMYASAVVALRDLATGAHDRAYEFARQVRTLGYATSNPIVWLLGEWVAERCERLRGQRHDAKRRADEVAQIGRELAPGGASGATAMVGAIGSLGRGRPQSALLCAADALAGLHVDDPGNFAFHTHNVAAVAAAVLSDADRARRSAGEARRLYGPNVAYFAQDLVIAEAWASWANHDQRRAVQRLSEASAAVRDRGEWGHALDLDHEALRLGDHAAPARVVEAAHHVSGPLAEARRGHALALRAEDGSALESVAGAFRELGADLLALDALAHGVATYSAQGLLARAQGAFAQLGELQRECQGARTFATQVLAAPAALTTRESEVARLAGEGRSNTEIADRLTVSVRTVESHLGRAYSKLGINSRSQLRSALALPAADSPEPREH
jgi:DNA-binding CsgD family transcriptional regulator